MLRKAMFLASIALSGAAHAADAGVLLERLTWIEAERVLTPDAVVVIALGAQAKEHGPHLTLANDFLMAEYLKRRVLAASKVVVAPTINYGYYPAFVDYPGSTSLRLETARDLVVDVCRGLAKFGPRRFYIVNTGVSTLKALEPAAAILAQEKITLRYTNILEVTAALEKALARQEGGTHADEIETSLLLSMAPESVDMKKAVKDYHPRRGPGPFTRDAAATTGVYSPTGSWGDPTLATREKGRRLTEAMVAGILAEIEQLRAAER
jgi:creatinine amidohydrolase